MQSFIRSLLESGTWFLVFEGLRASALFTGGYGGFSLRDFAWPVVVNTTVLRAWSALYFGIKYQRNLPVQQECTLRGQTLAREAQIQMLRSQLISHVPFNALNVVAAHVRENANEAVQTVAELGDFLRAVLNPGGKHALPGTFRRIHRSTIVNLDHVEALAPTDPGDIVARLTTGTRLRFSRSRRKGLEKRLGL